MMAGVQNIKAVRSIYLYDDRMEQTMHTEVYPQFLTH